MGSYRFGTVEVRPAERRVLVEGTPAALGARAFDLLLALIEHRDRVVSKDELLGLVWPGLVVEENNLQVQVSTLRKILGRPGDRHAAGQGLSLHPVAPGRRRRRRGCGRSLAAQPARGAQQLHRPRGRDRPAARAARSLATGDAYRRGGTGKSRLSVHLAAAVLAEFPDGAWRVELAATQDDGLVGLAIASALGVQEIGARRAAGRAPAAADPRQLRAPGARVRRHWPRGLLESRARPARARHQPRAAARRGRVRLPRAAPRRGAQAIELFVDRARAAQPRLRARRSATRRRWPRSAAASTACRSPSSWPRRACARCPSPRSPSASTTASGCSPAATRRPSRTSRRCAPRSSGATSCCPRPSVRCCAASRSSRAAGRWRRPRQCAAAARCRSRSR